MVTIKTIKTYFDVVLNKSITPGFVNRVPPARARKLLSMGLAEILEIDKLKKREQ